MRRWLLGEWSIGRWLYWLAVGALAYAALFLGVYTGVLAP